MWSAHGTSEESRVAGFGGVDRALGLVPTKAIRLIGEHELLKPVPAIDVLHHGMWREGGLDVLDPGAVKESAGHGAGPASSAGHKRDDMRRDVRDGLVVEPVVFPEEGGASISQAPICGCTKYGASLRVIWEL